jgi:DNA-binding transcriptional MocR family regulator
MKDWSAHFAPRAKRMAASEIRELLKLLDQPDIISFAGGIPDPALFPREKLAAAFSRALSDPQRAANALQYSVSEGYLPLREWLAGYMGRMGVTCEADNIIITNGSQQALDFLGKLCIAPNDRVLVAWPTYLGALQAFNCYEPQYDSLPGPESNRTVASYLTGGNAPRLAYVMPEFQNPTGTSLDRAGREALLDAADQLDLLVIEDSAYEKLRYDGQRAPSLMQLSIERTGHIDDCRVVYCGTFSKTIVPALRLGWAVAPRSIVQKLVLIKQASDLHSATINQMVMHEVASELIEPLADKIRGVYKARRDAMLAALKRHMPAGIDWTKPEGGMFVWVTLPADMDGAKLLARAIHEARVAFVPGEAFYADRSQRNHIRLSFSRADEQTIEEGIARLGKLLKS